MKWPLEGLRTKVHDVCKKILDVKEYLWVCGIFFTFIAVILDLIYYKFPSYWMSTGNCLGKLCAFARKTGFSYTGYLRSLKNNFSMLVTAMSVIITMCVNNLNRSEIRVFGLTRTEICSSRKPDIYKYWRSIVLVSPLLMIFAGYWGLCILGYGTLLSCYLFIVFSFISYERSFRRNNDLVCIVKKLRQCVDQNVQDQEDIVEYRMLLNIMRQWNDENNYWEGANYLFREICDLPENDNFRRRYILCYCFYNAIYARQNEANYDRAVYALKEYISRRDIRGWSENDYQVCWGLLHCLFTERKGNNIFPFVKWYLDFPTRAKRLGRRCRQENNLGYSGRLSTRAVRLQTGLFLIEMELYFNSDRSKEMDDFLFPMLSQIWNEGRYILKEENEELRRGYLEVNALYDLETNETEMRLRNLCADDRDGTTKSMTAYYLKNS